ncbi:unnamed protein product [Protopolystoma xenopodis]|uniref:Uncharacterized protein n=1 Tax=Protopolystoma xenopodis TaxID=117903 RepID=A0A448XJ93_9PLAT|nr:unnamed protein product [Protopolystoma xenopodis]
MDLETKCGRRGQTGRSKLQVSSTNLAWPRAREWRERLSHLPRKMDRPEARALRIWTDCRRAGQSVGAETTGLEDEWAGDGKVWALGIKLARQPQ